MKKFLAASLALTFLGTLAQSSIQVSAGWFSKKPEEKVVYTYDWYNKKSCPAVLIDFKSTVMEKLGLYNKTLSETDAALKEELTGLFKSDDENVVVKTCEILDKYNKQNVKDDILKIFNINGQQVLPQHCFGKQIVQITEHKDQDDDKKNERKNDNQQNQEHKSESEKGSTKWRPAVVIGTFITVVGFMYWLFD